MGTVARVIAVGVVGSMVYGLYRIGKAATELGELATARINVESKFDDIVNKAKSAAVDGEFRGIAAAEVGRLFDDRTVGIKGKMKQQLRAELLKRLEQYINEQEAPVVVTPVVEPVVAAPAAPTAEVSETETKE